MTGMTPLKKTLTLCLLLTLLLLAVGCGNKSTARPGQMAPDFTLKTLSEQTVTLSKLKGKKIFLNFWASWCVPCKTEMPDLQKMSRQYENQITVYGINMTSEDGIAPANRFVLENSLTFPILLDEDGTVKKDYLIAGVPVSITIDDGKIIERHEGQLSQDDMHNMFEHLLDPPKKSVAAPATDRSGSNPN